MRYPLGGYGDGARLYMAHAEGPAKDKIAKRLARLAGHAASLKRMWDEDDHCVEILTQISAVRAALDQVGKVILEHHIDNCVREAVEKGRAEDVIKDLKQALDRFV